MNERIKELAKLAGMDLIHDRFLTASQEKFAELLLQECIEVCKKQEYDYWRSSEEDQWTPIDSADVIAKHFGVEE